MKSDRRRQDREDLERKLLLASRSGDLELRDEELRRPSLVAVLRLKLKERRGGF